MNLYSNGERVIRATEKAYEAIYQEQGFCPYVEDVEEDKADEGAGGEKPDGEGETNENGAGAENSGKGKKPAAERKSAANK